MATLNFPRLAGDRGFRYWLRPANLVAARRSWVRPDHSTEWRDSFSGSCQSERSVPFASLLGPRRGADGRFRFLILGDTGEGDQSQYGLVPLLRAINPDFMIIAGDVAYPAGRINGANPRLDDYLCGFFQPYRNFNCPIWAVPGNHEYYANQRGWEFFQVFCTQGFASSWHQHGLRFVCQPGTYWELSDPQQQTDLVVIGLDTGQSANLDGEKPWWHFWKTRPRRDFQQHNWLRDRLNRADRQRQKVIVLFHIPALVRGDHVSGIYLKELHQILGAHPCVRLVVAGHEHNFQYYDSAQFGSYLSDVHSVGPAGWVAPEYVVSGGGGAYLTPPKFEGMRYQCVTYPSSEQWKNYASWAQKTIDRLNMNKSIMARVLIRGVEFFQGLKKDAFVDADAAKYLSFLLVEVSPSTDSTPAQTTVTPVFMDDLDSLYAPDDRVDVQAGIPPIGWDRAQTCLRDRLRLIL